MPLFVVMLTAALAMRIFVLQEVAYEALNCRWCVVPGILRADIPLLSFCLWMFLISFLPLNRFLAIPLKAMTLAGVLIYVADILVMSQFFTRLRLADARIYLQQISIVMRHLTTFPWWKLGLAALFLALIVFLCVAVPKKKLSWRSFIMGTAALTGLSLTAQYAIPYPMVVHDWAIRNIISTNLESGLERDYAPSTRDTWLRKDPPLTSSTSCLPGKNRQPHIVLLILESWSPYHSAYWSGLNNWTPRLDKLAREAMSFMRFHAGGFSTNDGLVSLFTGKDFILPIKYAHQSEPFDSAWGLPATLPRALVGKGYQAAFLTSGNLEFSRKGEWLRDIGFSYIEGHDHPDYNGIPRQHFDSVPDEFLYGRALNYIFEQVEDSRPALTAIESVSSHHPFVHPYTKERDEEAVFRYVDDSAADFIENLIRRGFLDHGIILVISDHRAMTPVSKKEHDRLGRSASSLIPAFVVQREAKKQAVYHLFHQADLLPSILRQIEEGEFCWRGAVRDLFEPEVSQPRCVMHSRGDVRHHVDIFCAEGSGTAKVRGDNSVFIDTQGLDAEKQRMLLDTIAWERIRTDAQSRAVTASRRPGE